MQLIKMFKWERCVIWSETNLRVETVTQIEQTVIPDDATSESVKDESSEEGFVSKGWTRGCGSSPVPEDLAQTMIRHRGCGWTCYSRNKESDIVKGGAVLVRNQTKHAKLWNSGSSTYTSQMSIYMGRIQTRSRRSKWRIHCQSFLCWIRYSS